MNAFIIEYIICKIIFEGDLIMIYYGKVVKYLSKGYGFIEGIPFTTSNFVQRDLMVFFHIRDIKSENSRNLIKNNNYDDFYFWYSIKKR